MYEEYFGEEFCNSNLEVLFFCSFFGVSFLFWIYCLVVACIGEFVQNQGGIMDDVFGVYVIIINWLNEVF